MHTTKRTGGLLVLLSAILWGAGCGTAARPATASGQPETVIRAETAAIKAALLGDMVNHGYTVEQDTEFSLTLVRALRGEENFAAGMTLGGTPSARARTTTYTLVRTAEGVRVIVSAAWRANLPGGQVRVEPFATGKFFTEFAAQMANIKAQLEGPARAAP